MYLILSKSKKFIRLISSTGLIIFFLVTGCVRYIKSPRHDNLIRVAIVCGVDQVRVSGIYNKKNYSDYPVSVDNDLPMFFNPQHGQVQVNGKAYHGAVEIQQLGKLIWVINIVGIEDYLKGVVPCEIGRVSENLIEAAKAQAVAARTYAWAHINQYETMGFDIYASIRDQVYNGISCENNLTNQAVEQTKGQVLTYKNKPVEAKYHSTCGGQTADFNDAWPGTPPPYLKSVNCSYCQKSPHYEWEKIYPKKDFFSWLRLQLDKIGMSIPTQELIKNIKLIRNRKSKRILEFIVITEKKEYSVPGYKIRTLLGGKDDPGGLLKSNYISLKAKGDKIIIQGRGWGHGVGMCQFGALEMARRGKTYKNILYHYYPGTKIKIIN